MLEVVAPISIKQQAGIKNGDNIKIQVTVEDNTQPHKPQSRA
jgi:urease accessory protein UreH